MNDLNLSIEFDINGIEPVLANRMYFAVPKKKRDGKYWATIASSWYLKNYQKIMKEVLKDALPDEVTKDFRYYFSTGVYDIEVVTTHYVPKKKFYESDVSNMIKSYEDCIATHLGIDDSRTRKYTVEKVPILSDEWKIHTTMILVEKNPIMR